MRSYSLHNTTPMERIYEIISHYCKKFHFIVVTDFKLIKSEIVVNYCNLHYNKHEYYSKSLIYMGINLPELREYMHRPNKNNALKSSNEIYKRNAFDITNRIGLNSKSRELQGHSCIFLFCSLTSSAIKENAKCLLRREMNIGEDCWGPHDLLQN